MSQVYLDAVLEPPRSLSSRGFDRVMLTLGCVSMAFGIAFLLLRAWPVAGFMGLEVLLLWAIFRMNFRAQTARTYLQVTAEAIDVRKVDAKGHERRARLPSSFARVEFDRLARGAASLRLAHSGKRYQIGEYLTPRERESLARRIEKALLDARRERHSRGE